MVRLVSSFTRPDSNARPGGNMTTLEQLKLAARDGRINRRDFVK
jgi:hypothetical protein